MLGRIFSHKEAVEDALTAIDGESTPDATPDDVPPPGPPVGFDGHPPRDHKDVPSGSSAGTIYGPGLGC